MAKKKTATYSADDVDDILDEMQHHAEIGANPKKFAPDAIDALRLDMKTRIEAKLGKGGDWPAEKSSPLLVAVHLGEICRILTKGRVISLQTAAAAYEAVRAGDEICLTPEGRGDWCA